MIEIHPESVLFPEGNFVGEATLLAYASFRLVKGIVSESACSSVVSNVSVFVTR